MLVDNLPSRRFETGFVSGAGTPIPQQDRMRSRSRFDVPMGDSVPKDYSTALAGGGSWA